MTLPPAYQHAWLCVGRVEDLPSPGSYLKAPLTPAGIVVVRGEDHTLRAFHAVCPHRGYAFVERDEGLARDNRLVCKYHGYGFGLDGAPCSGSGPLAPVSIAVAHGFVFVTLDDATAIPPLATALGEMPPWLQSPLQLRRSRRVAYDVAAHFGLVLENFQESLHFATVHPALEALTPSARAETWTPRTRGPWLGGIMPLADHAETVSLSARLQGRPFLVPEEDRRLVHDAMRFPNLLTSLQPDYLLTFLVYPLGEKRTHVVACTYVHPDAPDDALDDVHAFWDRVYEEDREACERQQLGATSLPAEPAFSRVEEGASAVRRMLAGESEPFCGIFGRPFVDLSEHIDTSCFEELHREITLALTQVEPHATGGTLKWMGVTAPWVTNEQGFPDAMHVLRAMPERDFAEFLSLAEYDASGIDTSKSKRDGYTFGDETEHPFSHAQEIFLTTRFGVYFPWKTCVHLLEDHAWDDKHSGEGKDFTDEAKRLFPKTIAFLKTLPMVEMGRVVLFGLNANDHAPVHRDSEPGKALALAQSISFEPAKVVTRRSKGFTLVTPDGRDRLEVDAPIYWFNDMDWHGVEARPWFRYSLRVDGRFDPAFLASLRRRR